MTSRIGSRIPELTAQSLDPTGGIAGKMEDGSGLGDNWGNEAIQDCSDDRPGGSAELDG